MSSSTQTKQEVLTEPIERLERALAADFPGHEREWALEVGSALGEMERALGLHTVLAETPDGLLTRVDLTRPTSVRQVRELRQEHTELQGQTRSLQAQLHRAAEAFQPPHSSLAKPDILPEPTPVGTVPDFGSIRQTVEQLLAALQHHQQEETKLLLESVNTDIGVGD